MTEADRRHGEQVRARLAAATPGPWCVVEDEDWEEVRVIKGAANRRSMPTRCTPICHVDQDDDTADAELIAHAPDDLVHLLTRAERAEAALARVESVNIDGLIEYEKQAYRVGNRETEEAVGALLQVRDHLRAALLDQSEHEEPKTA